MDPHVLVGIFKKSRNRRGGFPSSELSKRSRGPATNGKSFIGLRICELFYESVDISVCTKLTEYSQHLSHFSSPDASINHRRYPLRPLIHPYTAAPTLTRTVLPAPVL